MEKKMTDLQRCEWLVRFYDNRRFNTAISREQRKIAEKYYNIYINLYNKMYEELLK